MIRACALMDLPPGEAVRIVGPHAPIAVFNADGVLYAITDTCTHQDASLGEGTNLPAKRPVKTCPVFVKDGQVYVYVDVEVNEDVA